MRTGTKIWRSRLGGIALPTIKRGSLCQAAANSILIHTVDTWELLFHGQVVKWFYAIFMAGIEDVCAYSLLLAVGICTKLDPQDGCSEPFPANLIDFGFKTLLRTRHLCYQTRQGN